MAAILSLMSAGAWHCLRCGTLNLSIAEACRHCGRRPLASHAPIPSSDSAALAAALSFIVPGLGQVYAGRFARGLALFALPVVVLGVFIGALAVFDPLLAAVLRVAAGLAAALVVLVGAYHAAIVVDAFAAPATASRGEPRAYAALGAMVLTLLVLYVAAYQHAVAWGTLASRVFEPFQREVTASGAAPAWSGRERFNVLVLGIDTRADANATTQNTDTVMVLSLDPINRTAAMLSIPRDTVVPIPGRGDDKVNAVFAYGGAELSRRAIAGFLDIPVHGYVLVDFDGFRRIVDAAGGIAIDVAAPVRDEGFPTEDYGVTRVHIRAGPQLMDGDTALRYARSRHDSNDFSRAERQQRVVAALKRRVSESAMLLRMPALAGQVGDAVRTDLDPASALPLGRLAASVPARDMETATLLPATSGAGGQLREFAGAGGYYLVPVRAAVARLVAELFYDPRVRAEAPRVEIRSRDTRAALVEDLAESLSKRRYQVVRTSALAEQRRSVVQLRNRDKRYSAEQLARAIDSPLVEGGVTADADIVVLIGDDFRGLDVASSR